VLDVTDWQDQLREASRLRALGRVEEAIGAYERLLEANPDLPDSWYNLGWLQRKARRFEAALQSYERALGLGIREPEEVHLNRAVIFSDHLSRPDDAERELRDALHKNPAYVPALLNLGNLKEDLGDREAARDAYQRALAVDARNNLALARLAGISHSGELDQALAQQLRIAIAGAESAAEQADLGFALAGMLDAAGEYEEAFEAARAANEASQTASEARYDRAQQEQFVERQIEAFKQPATGDADAPTIFICGMFRSGSTLVEQILASHSRVAAGGELDLIPALAERIEAYPEAVAEADAGTVQAWREFYLAGLPPCDCGVCELTDKRPDNFLHIGLIKTLFPDAKIVHTRRNPLDNLLSLYFLHLDPSMAHALDLEDAAHWYQQYERLMAHWKALYPDDIFDVDYDELVREPKGIIEPLLNFLGLQWEDRLLDFHRVSAPVKTASVWQVRQPLHPRSSGRWKNYRIQLEPVAGLFS
jgi:tetratricopeptide (TPR) repeat protein